MECLWEPLLQCFIEQMILLYLPIEKYFCMCHQEKHAPIWPAGAKKTFLWQADALAKLHIANFARDGVQFGHKLLRKCLGTLAAALRTVRQPPSGRRQIPCNHVVNLPQLPDLRAPQQHQRPLNPTVSCCFSRFSTHLCPASHFRFLVIMRPCESAPQTLKYAYRTTIDYYKNR